MVESIKKEYRDFIAAVKTLEYKEVFIFMSVAIITFVSMQYANPNFYTKLFDTTYDRFYANIYWDSADGFLMFIVPMLLIFFVLKGKPRDYGFAIGDYKFGLTTYAIFMVVMIPVIWIISGNESFAKAYPQGGFQNTR